MNRFSITPPTDFVLARDACSYGYFLLAPNHWEPRTGSFSTVMDVGVEGEGGAVRVHVMQERLAGATLRVRLDRSVSALEAKAIRAGLSRMLRLDESAEDLAGFHALDARFKESGRGRLMRSATVFEDVIKTVTSCNVAWPSTIIMNRRLCETQGKASATAGPGCGHAFPTAARLARVRPASLRARCSVGYRDVRIVELAKMFVRGEINPGWLESAATSDEAIHEALLEWPGVGPYAAANIMQLLGRYERLPLDSESVRHGRDVLGFKGTPAQIMKKVQGHFAPFGVHRFRSYWFEVWAFYERKRGPAWTWERETTGKTFTASKLKDEDFAGERPPTGEREDRSTRRTQRAQKKRRAGETR
jgi:3-methyladenine DNA glycosylase/8-oxoguanine DNA glycosylase